MDNFDSYKKEFTLKAKENGFSSENIEKCLNYSKKLIENDLPVIYDLTHFSGLVGYNSKYIRRSIGSTKYFYRYFEINKKNGKKRLIAEPLPSLKEIQNWILHEILYKKKISRYAKAYSPGKGIKEHLRYHKNEKMVLTLDIDNFFHNIKRDLVFNLFLNFGYSEGISHILSELCLLNGRLPQGAPSSPCISNIVMFNFDYVISKYCRENKIKYSRYADDIVFSGDFDSNKLIRLVKSELKVLKLKLNVEKTSLMMRNTRQIISGIIVNDKIQVPKEIRNKIRNEIFYIKKFGLDNHLNRINESRKNYLLSLIGRINYILSFNNTDEEFKEYKSFLYQIPNGRSIDN